MAYILPDDYVKKIKEIAEQQAWSDDPDFLVDDYAGEIQFARSVLDAIGVEYTVESK